MDGGNDENSGTDIELFESWVQKSYGANSRTKTITSEKYLRICQLIRGEDTNSNAKFRFWVRSKGFRLLRHEKSSDTVLDDPCGSLFVSLHAKEDSSAMGEQSIEKFLRTNLPAISFFRRVAVVEEFYGIIKRAHVDEKGVHAGQKKTYRLVSDVYAFLPREVITFYLLNCNSCKPRIQKYGPINSRLKINNSIPWKIGPEIKTTSAPTDEKEQARKESKPTQVIRPAPKRYKAEFVNPVVGESYSTNPTYKCGFKPRNLNDVRVAEKKHHTNMQDYKLSTSFQQPSITYDMLKRSEMQQTSSYPSKSCEEIANKDYDDIPSPTYLSDTTNLKRRLAFEESQSYNIGVDGQYGVDRQYGAGRDDNELNYKYDRRSPSFISDCNSSFRIVEKKKEVELANYGQELHPYTVVDSISKYNNYKRYLLQASSEREEVLQQCCLPYCILSKRKNTYSYNEHIAPKKYLPSSMSWQIPIDASDITR